MSTIKKLLAFFFLTFLVTSCGHSAGGLKNGDPDLKKMHVNPGLFFAVALPASWMKVSSEKGAPPSAPSVTWRTKGQNEAGQPEVMLRVVSRPPETARGGFDHLQNDLREKRPGIEEVSSTDAVINGFPGRRIVGRFADRKTLIVFITAYRRTFTLEFTANADEFDAYRPLFEEILQSFQVL